MTRRPWTAADERLMVEGCGAFALQWFFARLKQDGSRPRSRLAIYHRARKIWGAGGLRRGVFSMRALAQQTGYHVDQIRRAQSALNHRYKRLTSKGPYLISYDQREDVVAWLSHDFWSKHLRVYRCLWCATVERPHHAVGLCATCYKSMTRLCCKLSMPSGCAQLADWVGSRDLPDSVALTLTERLGRGWCLDREWLVKLATLQARP